MTHVLQHHQIDQLALAMLHAGVDEQNVVVPRVFVVTDVHVGDSYIVAFCRTAGRAAVHGLTPRVAVDRDAFTHTIVDNADIPLSKGPCAAIGLVSVKHDTGKPVLYMEIHRYVPLEKSGWAYRELIASRTPRIVETAAPVAAEPEPALA